MLKSTVIMNKVAAPNATGNKRGRGQTKGKVEDNKRTKPGVRHYLLSGPGHSFPGCLLIVYQCTCAHSNRQTKPGVRCRIWRCMYSTR